MLITCPECGHNIPDQASSCPHCAVPLKNKGIQTIEQTGRPLKTQLIFAVAMLVVGISLLFGAFITGQGRGFAVFVTFFSLV